MNPGKNGKNGKNGFSTMNLLALHTYYLPGSSSVGMGDRYNDESCYILCCIFFLHIYLDTYLDFCCFFIIIHGTLVYCRGLSDQVHKHKWCMVILDFSGIPELYYRSPFNKRRSIHLAEDILALFSVQYFVTKSKSPATKASSVLMVQASKRRFGGVQ